VACSGQVAGNTSSIVVRPVPPVGRPQLVTNAVSTSIPVFPPPNFPTIQQALLGAASTGDQPVSMATTSAVGTVTASVVPDPAVVKTLLASKLARNMTQQQQTDVSTLQGPSDTPLEGTSDTPPEGTSHAPPAGTSDTLSESTGHIPSEGPSHAPPEGTSHTPPDVHSHAPSVGTCDTLEGPSHTLSEGPSHASLESTSQASSVPSCISVSSVSSTVSASASLLSVASHASDTVDNRVTESVTVSAGQLEQTSADSCALIDAVSDRPVSSSLCLANGHARQSDSASALVNGVCSPVPSCSSEDHDVRVVDYDSKCDGLVVNGESNDDNDDNDDEGSELDDCDGDVLVKAMMRADIIDCGGRPAVSDDDSHMSTDFLSAYMESTQEPLTTADQPLTTADQLSAADTSIGFDSETAAAVADLLHETGMMADDMSHMTDESCMSCDNDVTVSAADDQRLTADTSDVLCVATDDDSVMSAGVDDCSLTATVFDRQSGTIDVTQSLAQTVQCQLVSLSCQTGTAVDGLSAPASLCPANVTSTTLPQLSSSTVPTQLSSSAMPTQLPVGSVPAAAAQLHNGLMVVPPRGISLPSGQFISGGTRLLIRPITSVPQAASNNTASLSVRLSQPSAPAPIQPAVSCQSAGVLVASASSSSTAGVNSQLPMSNVTMTVSAPALRFVSSTTSQGQLIIQRAQILASSTSSPLIQRVIVPPTPRPIAMRSEGQMALQPGQPTQQISSQPVLLTRTPFGAGQLRVAPRPAMQLVTHSQSTPTQIVLQSGHVISVQPSTSGPLQHAAAANLPILAAKPSSEAQQNDSSGDDGTPSCPNQPLMAATGAQPSTNVKPSLRPTSQQPVQIVGAPVQLRAGLVGLPTGGGNTSVILQHGGRPILLQSPNVASAQHPSSYVVFRPGPLAVPSSNEHTNNTAVSSTPVASNSSSASSSSLGPDVTSRKRPLPSVSGTVTRSLRKKTKKDEDCALPFMCEWSACHKCVFLTVVALIDDDIFMFLFH